MRNRGEGGKLPEFTWENRAEKSLIASLRIAPGAPHGIIAF